MLYTGYVCIPDEDIKIAKGTAMANIMNHIAYLSQEIGARPANTEEEQRAAVYISDTLKKDARLDAEIEEFYCNAYPDLTRAIYCTLTVLVLLLAHFVPALTIPAFIITLLMAAMMVAESLGHPMLSRVFAQGISQNVVAKYVPPVSNSGVARRRKILLVANYDSGKVRRDTAGPLTSVLGIIQKVVVGAMVAVPVLLLFKFIFVHSAGTIATIFTVLLTIAGLLCLLPLVLYIVNYLAPFSDASNNNATGVATMLDIARLVGSGKLSAPVDPTGINHGEYAAAGVIPEGAGLTYEAAMNVLTPEEELIAAKAAIAAMTGQPLTEEEEEIVRIVEEKKAAAAAAVSAAATAAAIARAATPSSTTEESLETPADEAVEDAVEDTTDADSGESGAPIVSEESMDEETAAETEAEEPAPVSAPKSAVPDWYTQAKAAAKRNAPIDDQPIHKSRYAVEKGFGEEDFLEIAQAIMNKHTKDINLSEDERFLNLQADIMNVQAPHFESTEPVQTGIPEADPFNPYEYMPDYAVAEMDEQLVDEAPSTPEATPAEDSVIEESIAEAPVTETSATEASVAVDEPARAPRDVYYLSEEQADALIMDPTLPIDPIDEETKAAIAAQGEDFDYSSITASTQADGESIPADETTTAASSQSPAATEMPDVDTDATIAMSAVDADAATEMPAADASATTAMPAVGGDLDLDALRQEAAKPTFDPMNSDATQELPQRLIAEIAQPAAMAQERYAATTPDILSSAMLPAIDANDFKQRAPLAAVAESDTQTAAQSLLAASLPTIESDEMPVPEAHDVASVPMHVTSAFEPIAIPESIIQEEEAMEDFDDFFVDDAEDSGYAQEFNDASDFASTGYVEMPQSRLSKFFGKFSRKKKRQEESASSWLGVDDDFDARTVGKDRGGWESFRDDDDDWEGGAFSNIRDRFARKEGFQLDGYDDYDTPYDEEHVDYDDYDDELVEQVESQHEGDYEAQYEEHADYDDGATMAMPAVQADAPVVTPAPVQASTPAPALDDPSSAQASAPAPDAPVSAQDSDQTVVPDSVPAQDSEPVSTQASDPAPAPAQEMSEQETPAQEVPVQEAPVRPIPSQSDPVKANVKVQSEPAETPDVPVERESVEFGRQYSDQYADVYADQYGKSEETAADAYTNDCDAEQGEQSSDEYTTFPDVSDEIFSFASGSLDTEVWFVALGAELAENGGMKAFMNRHADEMRGSVVINLESLGAGELCYLEEEGHIKSTKLSTRMKRYLRQAAQMSGVEAQPAAATWRDTAASLAAKQRLQAVTLVGMDGPKPAGLGEATDTIDGIDPEVLRANEHFIIDMMKSI